MEVLIVHPRVVQRHPDISEQNVREAWQHVVVSMPRINTDPPQFVAIGIDVKNRQIEMVGVAIPPNTVVIYHAFTPPTRRILFELGLIRRK